MNNHTTMRDVPEEYRENALHGSPDFPLRVYPNDFRWYNNNTIEWHWHPEIEVAVVLAGSVRVHISDMVFEVSEGQGFFINSNVMHMETPAQEGGVSLMNTAVFLPEFIGDCGSQLIYRRFVKPVIGEESVKGLILSGENEWERRVLSAVQLLYAVTEEAGWGWQLRCRNIVGEMWYEIASNLRIGSDESQNAPEVLGETRVKKMMSFIHDNYSADITVADIARSANISKSECFRCFRRIIGKKPVEYLSDYRLKTAARLLRTTDMQVTEVCLACGFNHISYFGKVFRQRYGVSPRDYAKANTGNSEPF